MKTIIIMKLGIIGSRSFDDYKKARKIFKNFFQEYTTTIISGGANGADKIGAKLAKEFDVELVEFIPDWEGFGKGAGMIRNTKIIEASDMILAFWDGISKGTLDSLNKAKAQKKPVFIIYY